jgi:hypothetical protein
MKSLYLIFAIKIFFIGIINAQQTLLKNEHLVIPELIDYNNITRSLNETIKSKGDCTGIILIDDFNQRSYWKRTDSIAKLIDSNKFNIKTVLPESPQKYRYILIVSSTQNGTLFARFKTNHPKVPKRIANIVSQVNILLTNETFANTINEILRKFQIASTTDYSKDILEKGRALIARDGRYNRCSNITTYNKKGEEVYIHRYQDFIPSIDSNKTHNYIHNPVYDGALNMNLLYERIGNFSYHHPSLRLDEWRIVKCCDRDYKIDLKANQPDSKNFVLKVDSFQLTPSYINVKPNEQLTNLACVERFTWLATFCNFFQFDLQTEIWGKPIMPNTSASGLIAHLKTDKTFIELTRNEGMYYADHGYYVVYLVPGHITALLKSQGKTNNYKDYYVIQSGAEVGIKKLELILSNFPGRDDLKCYAYVGHIK